MKTLCGFRVGALLGPVALAVLLLNTGLAQEAPKKVTKAEGLNAVTSKVAPEYPPIARQLKIEGAVELEAVVTEGGVVEKVNIVSGNPVLTRPASDAIKKWKFAPFTSDGKAVKALVPVTLSFKL
jgi:TonB family protein